MLPKFVKNTTPSLVVEDYLDDLTSELKVDQNQNVAQNNYSNKNCRTINFKQLKIENKNNF